MSVNIETSLKEVLEKLERKIDDQYKGLEQKLDKLDGKIDNIAKDVNELKVSVARLDEKVDGLSKRLENQEFVSRGVLIALIVAILGSFAKLFGFVGNP
jgi:archaellum component FlaC